ncbi:MAG: T9SS type A sorting domain-containing protein [Bacteroidetes bacterium]|nr:T9SS type A sorting domain-containing protein [Bacteroidota bacterium]
MSQSGNTLISIMDVKGSIVHTVSAQLQSGVQSVDLDVSGLTSGLYQIVVRQGSDIQTSRLLID